MAYIVLAAAHAPPGELEQDIEQLLWRCLAPYEYPMENVFIDPLSMTTIGKVQRKTIAGTPSGANSRQVRANGSGSWIAKKTPRIPRWMRSARRGGKVRLDRAQPHACSANVNSLRLERGMSALPDLTFRVRPPPRTSSHCSHWAPSPRISQL